MDRNRTTRDPYFAHCKLKHVYFGGKPEGLRFYSLGHRPKKTYRYNSSLQAYESGDRVKGIAALQAANLIAFRLGALPQALESEAFSLPKTRQKL